MSFSGSCLRLTVFMTSRSVAFLIILLLCSVVAQGQISTLLDSFKSHSAAVPRLFWHLYFCTDERSPDDGLAKN